MTNQPIIDIEELASDGSTAMVVAALAQQAVGAQPLDAFGVYAALNPEGGIELLETPGARMEREDSLREGPRRIKRTSAVADVPSLLDVIAAHNDEDGAYALIGSSGCLEVWADLASRTISTIHDGLDGWREHRTRLELRHSTEWADWVRVDGQMLDQVEFAEFIEDHLSTIGEPDGAQLLDICQTLQATTGTNFKQQNILANGQRAFRWEEHTEASAGQKGDLKIPGELKLVLRPFQGSEPRLITARFRFRPQHDGLRLGVRLVERERVLEDAFMGIVDAVQAGLPGGVRVRYGLAW